MYSKIHIDLKELKVGNLG